MAAAASLALPVPALAAFNKYTTQYPLDRLHYILFQLLLVILVPALAAASGWVGSGVRLELTRDGARQEAASPQPGQPRQSTAASPEAAPAHGGSHVVAAQEPARKLAEHKYAAQCVEIERRFLELAAGSGGAGSGGDAASPWVPLTSLARPYPVSVEGHTAKPFCFRVVFYAPTAPGTAFDLLSDILRRPEWDELTEATRVVEELGPVDSIHYVKMKAVWPTAARDSLLLSHLAAVRTRDGDDGFLNVSQSIVDDRVPENVAAGIVRMEAAIAGQLVTKAPSAELKQLGLQGEHWCKVVQVADGDLKGWIPKSVIKFIATQALPRSLSKVCQQLSTLPPSASSQLLAEAPMLAPTPAPTPTLARPRHASSARAPLHRGLVAPPAGGRWSAWLRVLLRYAAPALVAAATSLLVQFVIGRRWRRR
ncbi:hypothetical protein LPJ61_001549 [Coemansia biformis]|uniref:START domain-containing protein n=1 Tax=Coemansia biformis TaxID=1286918 RepID=A0A9W7YGH5_9FUNG|nr:hypothetical protein LPJ61_001549 [Coemansia biformis]